MSFSCLSGHKNHKGEYSYLSSILSGSFPYQTIVHNTENKQSKEDHYTKARLLAWKTLYQSQNPNEQMEKWIWGMESLWDADTQFEKRFSLQIADTILIKDGRICSWFFTNRDGLVLKKQAKNSNWDNVLSSFLRKHTQKSMRTRHKHNIATVHKCTESGLQIDSLNQSEFIELIEYAIDNSLNDKMQCLSNEAPTWKKDWKNVFAVQECVISKCQFGSMYRHTIIRSPTGKISQITHKMLKNFDNAHKLNSTMIRCVSAEITQVLQQIAMRVVDYIEGRRQITIGHIELDFIRAIDDSFVFIGFFHISTMSEEIASMNSHGKNAKIGDLMPKSSEQCKDKTNRRPISAPPMRSKGNLSLEKDSELSNKQFIPEYNLCTGRSIFNREPNHPCFPPNLHEIWDSAHIPLTIRANSCEKRNARHTQQNVVKLSRCEGQFCSWEVSSGTIKIVSNASDESNIERHKVLRRSLVVCSHARSILLEDPKWQKVLVQDLSRQNSRIAFADKKDKFTSESFTISQEEFDQRVDTLKNAILSLLQQSRMRKPKRRPFSAHPATSMQSTQSISNIQDSSGKIESNHEINYENMGIIGHSLSIWGSTALQNLGLGSILPSHMYSEASVCTNCYRVYSAIESYLISLSRDSRNVGNPSMIANGSGDATSGSIHPRWQQHTISSNKKTLKRAKSSNEISQTISYSSLRLTTKGRSQSKAPKAHVVKDKTTDTKKTPDVGKSPAIQEKPLTRSSNRNTNVIEEFLPDCEPFIGSVLVNSNRMDHLVPILDARVIRERKMECKMAIGSIERENLH